MTEQVSRSCLVLVGPTAVGKTALIAELASSLPLEVISLDSRQIYRGLDIGTAKPTAEEQRRVPHLGIDLVSPGWLIFSPGFRRSGFSDLAKRLLDVFVSALLLLVTWPIMLLVALDYLSSERPFAELFDISRCA